MLKKAELMVMGPEPMFSDPITDPKDFKFVHIYNWYTYFYTHAEAKEWVKAYMKKDHWSDRDIWCFMKSPDYKTPFYMCVHARMINNGLAIPELFHDRLYEHIENITLTYRDYKEQTTRPTVQNRVQEKILEVIGVIENVIDTFFVKNHRFFEPNIYKLLQEQNVKPSQARAILEYYLPLLEEVAKAARGKVEGYEHLSKGQCRAYERFVEAIVADLDRYVENEKAAPKARKPRKKKAKSALQIVKKLKFAKADKETKTVSIDPVNIVGASSVWLYNVKTRKLTNLVSYRTEGLSVKGTTIIGFDEKGSETKILRKPAEVIAKVLKAGKIGLRPIFKDLTTKPADTTGRVGEDTIILRALK